MRQAKSSPHLLQDKHAAHSTRHSVLGSDTTYPIARELENLDEEALVDGSKLMDGMSQGRSWGQMTRGRRASSTTEGGG